jgi:hypothetical protein
MAAIVDDGNDNRPLVGDCFGFGCCGNFLYIG